MQFLTHFLAGLMAATSLLFAAVPHPNLVTVTHAPVAASALLAPSITATTVSAPPTPHLSISASSSRPSKKYSPTSNTNTTSLSGFVLGTSTAPDGYITQDELTAQIDQATNALRSLIYQNDSVPNSLPATGGYTNNIALANDIDQLTGTKLKNITVNGVAGLTAADIPPIDLASKVTGVLSTSSGGTGTSTAPASNQLMLADASGNWEYVATSTLGISGGSSSQWFTSGLNIFYTGGDVGIGTSSPDSALSVSGSGHFTDGVDIDSGSNYEQGGTPILFTSSGASTTDGTIILGQGAGLNLATSTSLPSISGNIAIGYQALQIATSSGSNTAIGYTAMNYNTSGRRNTAVGWSALWTNNTGQENTAIGYEALLTNVIGSSNTAVGFNALDFLDGGGGANPNGGQNSNGVGGSFNTALGDGAMGSTLTGSNNVAVGYQALFKDFSATNTVAVGYQAGSGDSVIGDANQGGTYVGYEAGRVLQTASDFNTLIGYQAGKTMTTGTKNIVIGPDTSGSGTRSITSGSNNIIVGIDINAESLTGSNQLNIGNILFGSGLTGTGSTVAGLIGIGTTTPASKLEVYSSNSGTSIATFGDPSISVTNSNATVNNFSSLAFRAINDTGAEFTGARLSGVFKSKTTGSESGDLAFITDNSGSNGERMRLTAAGSLGIGTSTPNSLLEVSASNSATTLVTFGDPTISITNRNTTTNNFSTLAFRSQDLTNGAASSTAQIEGIATSHTASQISGTLAFLTQNAGSLSEKARITAAGNLGVGSTTPWRTLSVTGTVGFDGLGAVTGTNSSLCLDSNKQVVFSSNSDSCASSLRSTKHDISALTLLGTTTLAQLVPVSFIYNNDASSSVRYGFIAEDAAAVNSHFGTYDQNGNLSGIDDRSFIAVIVKATQELVTEVDNLESTVSGFAQSFASDNITVNNKLCIKKSDGTPVCITGDQLSALLSSQGMSASAPLPQTASPSFIPDATTSTPEMTDATTSDPAPADTASTTEASSTTSTSVEAATQTIPTAQ